MWLTYSIIAVMLIVAELMYFKIAEKCNIIDKPNERSSHSAIVLRGGGIIFAISMIVWAVLAFMTGDAGTVMEYVPFLCGLVLVAGISFIDDIVSLPDCVRLLTQFVAMALMFWSMGIMHWEMWWIVLIALIISVGATNVINFMDGINGITAGYSLAVLVPLIMKNEELCMLHGEGFIDKSFLVVSVLGLLVFSVFNFRPKGKAKCFAGDVGSIGIAFIMMFSIGKLIIQTNDVTWLILLLVYGVDGCMTIVHRIMLHENLGEAHRKHAYQLMANELKMGHVKVTLLYIAMQLVVSCGFIFVCPDNIVAHWIYLVCAALILIMIYIFFMKKYYHLHEEYLRSLQR